MGATATRRPSFHGEGGQLLGIFLVNLLLTAVTFGIYSFWARTKIRRYMWSQTEFEGDRFTYHGTGGELLKGWLMAMAVFFGLGLLIAVVMPRFGGAGTVLGPIVAWLCILCLVPVAIIGARRYRLSRTTWRGIRFSVRGDVGEFVKLYLGKVFLTVITLGLYSPYMQNDVRRYLTENSYFGTHRFGYDGEGRDLFKPFLVSILLTIPTLGLCWIWYYARRHRQFWGHTTFGGARFVSTVTGGGLFMLGLTSWLLVVFTLGIGTPWALVRLRRFFCDNLALEGELDPSAIRQEAVAATAMGEAFADALDVGGGFDLGL
jgi:uncharacterized membrane protein YjgN (DUF898 family)